MILCKFLSRWTPDSVTSPVVWCAIATILSSWISTYSWTNSIHQSMFSLFLCLCPLFTHASHPHLIHSPETNRANDGKEEKQWRRTAGHLLWNLPWLGQLLPCCATGRCWWVDVFHRGGAHWLTGGKLHGILEDICQRKPLGAWAITQIPERENAERKQECQRDAGKQRERET